MKKEVLQKLLDETIESLATDGHEVGQHASHKALIFAFTQFAWSNVNKYENGVIHLNWQEFEASSLEKRKAMIDRYLGHVIADVFSSMSQNKK